MLGDQGILTQEVLGEVAHVAIPQALQETQANILQQLIEVHQEVPQTQPTLVAPPRPPKPPKPPEIKPPVGKVSL